MGHCKARAPWAGSGCGERRPAQQPQPVQARRHWLLHFRRTPASPRPQLADQIKALSAKLHATVGTLQGTSSSGASGTAAAAPASTPPQQQRQQQVHEAAAAPVAAPARERIAHMSGEVVDSNPYSRLMALQRMGIVKDYERIREKTVRPPRAQQLRMRRT